MNQTLVGKAIIDGEIKDTLVVDSVEDGGER
jgi:hypothetical protein